VHVKFGREGYGRSARTLLARRVRADMSWLRALELAAESREATLGKGAGSTSTTTPDVEHTNPRGWSSTPVARRIAAARGAARSCGADFRSGKSMYGGFRLKLPYPTPLRSEPQSDFPTQHVWISHRRYPPSTSVHEVVR
jgi:hypothetical protein